MLFAGLSVAAMFLAQATVAPSQMWPPPPVTVPSVGSQGAPPQPLTVPSIGSLGAPPSPEPSASYGKSTEQYQPPSVRSQ